MADVLSEMVGKVWKIEAQVGQEVAEDDIIVILESMKMEIPIMSPIDGVVKEIRVTEGQTVQEGDVVAIVE
jgi:acetyl-CoA carboxylase biotin carboxyl carrier protein